MATLLSFASHVLHTMVRRSCGRAQPAISGAGARCTRIRFDRASALSRRCNAAQEMRLQRDGGRCYTMFGISRPSLVVYDLQQRILAVRLHSYKNIPGVRMQQLHNTRSASAEPSQALVSLLHFGPLRHRV